MLIPDQETSVDYLRYESISSTVIELLSRNQTQPVTIGIHGDWGAGKSSVLKMIQEGLKSDSSVACLWFNGWTFQGFDDAKTVLVEDIVGELRRQRSGIEKVKAISSSILKRVEWLKVLRKSASLAWTFKTGLPSPDHLFSANEVIQQLTAQAGAMSGDEIATKLSGLSGLLKPAEEETVPDQIHAIRRDFEELLKEAKIKQLVVLIDDLDRCLPETAISTLEAVRLLLFVPGTAFVIGADEGMIEYAVRRHFPDLPVATAGVPYARNYLEKLIQVPFRIPSLGVQEARTYISLLLVQSVVGQEHEGFRKLTATAKKTLNEPWLGTGLTQSDITEVDSTRSGDLAAAYVLAEQIGPILAQGTSGNPRQIKRFLNSLSIRLSIAAARGFGERVNQAMLAKLMLAERFQSDFYDRLVAEAMSSANGRAPLLKELEANADGGAGSTGGKGVKAKGEPIEQEKTPSQEWRLNWTKLKPSLANEDLRPYIFVARDKRLLSPSPEVSPLAELVDSLTTTAQLAVRAREQQIKALNIADAAQVFAALRDLILRPGNLASEPAGFKGIMLLAKHHPEHQVALVTLVGGFDPKNIGFWIVPGWTDVLTEKNAKDQFSKLLTVWASQEINPKLAETVKRAQSAAGRRS